MAVRSKVFEYTASVDADGTMRAEGGGPVSTPEGWAADHLVMAGLVRCSLGSLRHHAERAGLAMEGSGTAHATVSRREDDGRFAITDVEVELLVRLDPSPAPDVLADLIARAERGCFVGASLRAAPVYRWTVDGRRIG